VTDSTQLVINHLLGDSGLTTLLGGQNVFGGPIPEKFNPNIQPCVTIDTEGGQPHPEVPIAAARVKVKVWAGRNQGVLARQVDIKVSARLHGQNMIDLAPDGFIIIAQQTVLGQAGIDPELEYATVLSFYEITSRDSA
jgi:hypothetical protein